jgi:hypothetical protein
MAHPTAVEKKQQPQQQKPVDVGEKRKRKREVPFSGRISLGDIVHPEVVPHFLPPVLKKRFFGCRPLPIKVV